MSKWEPIEDLVTEEGVIRPGVLVLFRASGVPAIVDGLKRCCLGSYIAVRVRLPHGHLNVDSRLLRVADAVSALAALGRRGSDEEEAGADSRA